MIFEILLTYRHTDGTDIQQHLSDVLGKVLEDNYVEFDATEVGDFLNVRHARLGAEHVEGEQEAGRHILLGIELALPGELDSGTERILVDEFVGLLFETPPVLHLVKFEDPLLREDLAVFANEIFLLEMKLRRVLTLIYLHAHQSSGPYDLLRDEATQITAKEKPSGDQMKAVAENQFFHLTFGQYVGLNTRSEIKQVSTLLDIIRASSDYDAFRTEISRLPIEQEDDAVLLAGLRERMNAIEAMRNCVAHNRRPTRRMVENYTNARPLLDHLLDGYLARWEMGGDLTQLFAQPPVEEGADPPDA
jgi:hypothetical protein